MMNTWKAKQKTVQDKKLEEICGDMPPVVSVKLGLRRALKGHLQKVNAVHYAGDSRWVEYFHNKIRKKIDFSFSLMGKILLFVFHMNIYR